MTPAAPSLGESSPLELRRRALRSGVFLLLDRVLVGLFDEGFHERKRIVLLVEDSLESKCRDH